MGFAAPLFAALGLGGAAGGGAGAAAAGGASALGAGPLGTAIGTGASAGMSTLGAGPLGTAVSAAPAAAAGKGFGAALAGGAKFLGKRVTEGFDAETGDFSATRALLGEKFGERFAKNDKEKELVEGMAPEDAIRRLLVARIFGDD